MFNVFRFFVNFAAESYVFAGVVFWIGGAFFSHFKKLQVIFFNVLHLIGLGLATLCVLDDINTIVRTPGILSLRWVGYFHVPEYYLVTIISFLCPAIAAIILWSKSRRGKVIWGIAAMTCILVDPIVHYLWMWYRYAISKYMPDHPPALISMEPIKIVLYLLLAGSFFSFSYYLARHPYIKPAAAKTV